jgi:NADPH:quinone reductase-like Zn-dependent oxidoreductase
VFDAIGGKSLLRSDQTLRAGGQLINYGVSSAVTAQHGKFLTAAWSFFLLTLLQLFSQGRKAVFYSIAASKKRHPDWLREDLTQLLSLLTQRKIKPIISRKIPLVEATRAHELLNQSAISGKIVLLCNLGY